MRLAILVFFLLQISVFAIYCPNCGQHNDDNYNYCYACGKPLPKQKTQKQSMTSTFPSGASTENYLQGLKQFMGMGAVNELLGLNNQSISDQKLNELNNNPQVINLMQQMKSKEFQKSIIDSLKAIAPMANDPNNLKNQANQIEDLFKLLNNSALNSDIQNIFQP